MSLTIFSTLLGWKEHFTTPFCLKTATHNLRSSIIFSYDKLSELKSRDTLPTKVHIVKAMIFQWSGKDVRVGPYRRLSTKELMLSKFGAGEDSWTERRSNQLILKEINLKYSLEGLLLKMKLHTLAT